MRTELPALPALEMEALPDLTTYVEELRQRQLELDRQMEEQAQLIEQVVEQVVPVQQKIGTKLSTAHYMFSDLAVQHYSSKKPLRVGTPIEIYPEDAFTRKEVKVNDQLRRSINDVKAIVDRVMLENHLDATQRDHVAGVVRAEIYANTEEPDLRKEARERFGIDRNDYAHTIYVVNQSASEPYEDFEERYVTDPAVGWGNLLGRDIKDHVLPEVEGQFIEDVPVVRIPGAYVVEHVEEYGENAFPTRLVYLDPASEQTTDYYRYDEEDET